MITTGNWQSSRVGTDERTLPRFGGDSVAAQIKNECPEEVIAVGE